MLSLHQLESARLGKSRWSVFYWTKGILPVKTWWLAGLLAAVSFTMGCQTRLSTVLLWALQVSMLNRNRLAMNGEDLAFRMLLFYSCFAPLGYCLSIDLWRQRRGSVESMPLPSIWPVRLLQVNVALVYALSLPQKLVNDPAWRDGTALYWTMMNDTWSRWPGQPVFLGGFLCAALTYGTILAEGLFQILVWFRRTRFWALGAIASTHLGIVFLLQNITFFSLSMICSFLLFVPASSLRSMPTRFRAALSKANPNSLDPQTGLLKRAHEIQLLKQKKAGRL